MSAASQCAGQLLDVNARMRALKESESELAALRRQLIMELAGKHRWKQVRIAAMLGVTPQRISIMLRVLKRRDRE